MASQHVITACNAADQGRESNRRNQPQQKARLTREPDGQAKSAMDDFSQRQFIFNHGACQIWTTFPPQFYIGSEKQQDWHGRFGPKKTKLCRSINKN